MNIETLRQAADFCFVYLVTLLGRAALCSYLMLALTLALRRTFLKNAVFLKGFLWSIFLLAPFMGKLKLFYENPFAEAYQAALACQGMGRMAAYPLKALALLIRLFFLWGNLCIEQPWVCRVYFLGALASFLLLCRQRRKTKKLVAKMIPWEGCDGVVVNDWMVTPFSTGLLSPKIVLPEAVLKHCGREEIDLMILHEKIHIRLGHLWSYALWDLLRSLFWMNPFLTVCAKYFREDLEDICDRVTIQKSKRLPCEYGELLLKTVQLLQKERMAFTVTFAGEKGYGEFRRRIQRIMEFRPYQKSRAICLRFACLIALAGMFMAVRYSSYPDYVEMDFYLLMSDTGDRILIDDSEALKTAVSKDEQSVYIERDAMEALFQEYKIYERTFYLGFGGYMKLPGMGGGGCCVYVDCEENQGNLVIPYREPNDILNRMIKIL